MLEAMHVIGFSYTLVISLMSLLMRKSKTLETGLDFCKLEER